VIRLHQQTIGIIVISIVPRGYPIEYINGIMILCTWDCITKGGASVLIEVIERGKHLVFVLASKAAKVQESDGCEMMIIVTNDDMM